MAALMYATVAEYETAIAETQAAISRVLQIGQENGNSSGGSSRQMKDADLKTLREHLSLLQKQKAALSGGGGLVFTPNW